jgi:spermidine synthase
MLAHVPMFQNAHPRRIILIGGGDGYVLSEILKHGSVEHVDHVDLDGEVIETCKTHFSWSDAWTDPRVHLHIADGAKFVRNAPDQSYDVVIQDSSDPWTWGENGEKVVLPSSVLYSPEHFANIHRILEPNGVLNIQAESLQIPSDLNGIRDWRQRALNVGFESARYGSILISSYPTGQIGFLLCEKDPSAASSLQHLQERFSRMVEAKLSTSYYHPPLQAAAFVLPLWAMKHIYDDEVDPSLIFPQEEL